MSNKFTIIMNKLSVTKILFSLVISISVGNSMNFYEINTEYFPNNVLNYDGSCAQFDIISFSDNKSDANNTIDILDGKLLYIDDCNNNEYYKNFKIDNSNDNFIKITHNQFINKKRYIPDGLNDTYLELNNYYNNRTKDINIISNSIHKEEILLNSNKLNNQISNTNKNEYSHAEETLLKPDKLTNQVSNTNNNDINSKYNEYYLQLSKVCNVISQEELTNYIKQIQSVLDEKLKTI